MTRIEQVAQAYRLIAQCDHYLVTIDKDVTNDERDEAEQLLITQQNACDYEGSPEWELLELALDCLESDRKFA